MFTGWMSFGGTEIVNEARVAAYIKALKIPGSLCEDCPTLADALEETYVDPATDNAPWYDPAVPESGQIAGFQISSNDNGVSISGLGDTATRSVDQFTHDGGVVGRRRRGTRDITLTIRAVASTECALNYAIGWLSRILRGSECSPISSDLSRNVPPLSIGCGGDELCLLRCCPTTPADVDLYKVSVFQVGVTSGPTPVAQHTAFSNNQQCGLALCEVEVTFTAGDPGFYSSPTTIIDTALLPHFVELTQYDIRDACQTNILDTGCILTDVPEGCATTTVPIANDPPTPCVGPVSGDFNFYSIPVDFSALGMWGDLVPMLYYTGSEMGVFTGDEPAGTIQRNDYEGPVIINLRRTTLEAPCGTRDFGICDPCIEIYNPMFSTGQTNVIDWVSRKAYRITNSINMCPFAIYTRQLLPFNWPTLVCSSQMCMDIFVYADRDGRSQEIRLDVMRRQDALC